MIGQRLRIIPFLATIVLLFASLARPDGRVFVGADRSSLRPLAPREQAAAIVHRDGIEKMVIALNFDAEDKDSALWMFPVPGASSRTKVDIVDCFPQFWGRDPRAEARSTINAFMLAPPVTQIWPAILAIAATNLLRSRLAGAGISVSGEVEKWGIHAEIISAKNVDGLIAYLAEKKAGVEAERLRGFEPYLGGGYVLVAAWITSRAELFESFPESQYAFQRFGGVRRPALYVEFPAETAYYPLRPTAAYGDADIPVRLYIAGYVQPRTNAELARSLGVSYYQGRLGAYDREGRKLELSHAFKDALGAEEVEYTAVTYSGPARNFTDDLRFVPVHPFGMRFAALVLYLSRNGWDAVLLFILVVAGLSYLSAGLAGLYVRQQWHRYAAFGFLNLLTIAGFLLGVVHLALREGREFRAFRFIAAFTISFVVLGLILQLALLLLTGSASFDL